MCAQEEDTMKENIGIMSVIADVKTMRMIVQKNIVHVVLQLGIT